MYKDGAQIAALLGAGGFFAYKAISGYLRVNLTTFVSCTRQRAEDGTGDYLAIQLDLKKGPNGSVALHDVRALVKSAKPEDRDKPGVVLVFTGNSRLTFVPSADGSRRQVDWSQESRTSPLIKLVPDEETNMSVCCKVESEGVYSVEVAVLGKRVAGRKFGQWKASCISLPVLKVAPQNQASP